MGILLSSSPIAAAPTPVYSGVEKLLAIFEPHDEHRDITSSISSQARWKDVLPILLDALAESPATDHCFLEAMHIYKETNILPYHEMLLFEVMTESEQKCFMRIDRYVSNPNSNMFSDSNTTLVAAKSAENSLPCRSEHQVQIALSRDFLDESLSIATSASFSPRSASFRRLLDLLKLVSSDAYGDYNLWDRSCYWFSSVVYKTYITEFTPLVEIKGPAYANLGKFAKHGHGVDWLTAYLDDQGKLLEAWKARRSSLTPVGRFLLKEKGKAKIEYNPEQDAFLVRTRIGLAYTVFSAEGLPGDIRSEHIANGVYTADLNGRIINFTCHGSSLLDLRFKSRDEAQLLFEAIRCLISQRSIAFFPMDVLVDRRHTSIMIAQHESGPTFLDCSNRTVSSRPNLKRFQPQSFNLDARLQDVTPCISSFRPLQIEWRNKKQALVWKQEYLFQSGRTSDANIWPRYWEAYFQKHSI